jgi:hypothetical protein
MSTTDADEFWRKCRNKETTIKLKGGRLIVPGERKTRKGLLTLIVKAIAEGRARIEPKGR